MDQIQALFLSLGIITILVIFFIMDRNKEQPISKFEFVIITLNTLLAGGIIYYGLVYSKPIQSARLFLIIGLIEMVVFLMNEVFRYTTRKSIKKDILKFMIYCGLIIVIVGVMYYGLPNIGRTPTM